jgi:hypothetical protein
MTELRSSRGAFARFAWVGGAALLALSAARPACAQATAEAAATTSSAGVTTSQVSKSKLLPPGAIITSTAVLTAPQPQSGSPGSPHLIAHDGPPAEETNRKALEEQAGSDAAKLLMRSSPSGAQIFINDSFVGHTPLLMMLAPGKYKIEMRGQRDDTAQRTLGLLPHDTQEVMLKLTGLYPAQISTR